MIFFSSNAIHECQSLDQKIIPSFKPRFCHIQLNHLMLEYENWQSSEQVYDS